MTKLILPELGEGIEQALVSYWHFKEGDKVESGEDVVEMATDKATFNLPASASGILSKVYFEEGETVRVGDTLAEINEDQYPGEVPPSAYGEHVWQGAYVFSLDTEDGFVLKGRITHVEDDSSFRKSGWYYFGGADSVKRSLYIDNVLYTLSDVLIKMNSLGDLSEINKVELPFEQQVYPLIEETTAGPPVFRNPQ